MLKAIAGTRGKPLSLWLAGLGALFLFLTIASQVFAPQRPLPVVVPETWFVHSGTPLVGLYGPKHSPVFMHLFHSERSMYLALGVNPKKVDAYIEFQHKVHDPYAWLQNVDTKSFNPYLYFRKDAPWAYGLALGTSLATIGPANAFHRGTRISAPVIATGCSAYPNDNGCANAQPGVVGFTPGGQDTNFAFDVAQVGQVLPSANPGFAASLAAFTAVLHTVGDNEPGWDYPIGSNCNTGGSCGQIKNFIADGFCKWWLGTDAAGPLFASNPFVTNENYFYCREQGGSPGLNYVLANWDLSDGGVDSTGVLIFPINSNPHNMTFRNFYLLCTSLCVNNGQNIAASLVYTSSAAGANIPNVEFDFWTVDGGSPTGTGAPYPQQNYFYKDSRGRNGSTTVTYSLFKNLAGDPYQSGSGNNAGDHNWLYDMCLDCATTPTTHGEWLEPGGVNFARNYNFTGDVWFFAASYCAAGCTTANKKDMTTPIYDSGAANGGQFNNFIVHHNLNVLMPVNCNTSGARVPPYNPDNLASNCSGGGDGSFFELNNTTRVQIGDFAGNFADREIGDKGCYETSYGPQGIQGFQPGSLVSVTGPSAMSVTAVHAAGTQSLPLTMMYPGAWIHSFAHNASFTGAIAGNTLTITGIAAFNYVIPGQSTITGSGVTSALITAQLTGTTNGNGTYTINGATQTITARAMTGDDGFTDARMLTVNGPFAEGGAGTWNPFATFGGTNTTTVLTITNPAGGLTMTNGSTIQPTETTGIEAATSRGTISGTQTGTSITITSGIAYSGGLYSNENLLGSCTPGFQLGCGTINLTAGGAGSEPTLAARDGTTWGNYTSWGTINVNALDPSYWVYYGTSVTTPQLVTYSNLNSQGASCN